MIATLSAFLVIASMWHVPDGFQGVPFGATREEAEAILGPMKCRDVGVVTRPGDPVRDRDPAEIAPAHVVCRIDGAAAASAADSGAGGGSGHRSIDADYIFDRGRFVAVRFPRLKKLRHQFADVLAKFEHEYGPPSRTVQTPRKGLRDEMIQQRLVPTIYDYVETCAHWTDAPVVISVCSEDRMFRRGKIDTAEWWLRKQELIDNLPEQ